MQFIILDRQFKREANNASLEILNRVFTVPNILAIATEGLLAILAVIVLVDMNKIQKANNNQVKFQYEKKSFVEAKYFEIIERMPSKMLNKTNAEKNSNS